MTSFAGRVLVYGGKGALGSAVVTYFKEHNWWVSSIDLIDNVHAHVSIKVSPEDSWADQEKMLFESVGKAVGQHKLDALICVAGGWAGGNAASKDFFKNTELMLKQSVWSSVISAKIASAYLKNGGLLTLTGAKAALEETPGMIGYGMAKAAVHHLVKSLGAPKGGLPDSASAVAILPVTLDTPMNRKFMADADFTTWTPLPYVAELLYNWSNGTDCPKSGSLVQLITADSVTQTKID